MWRFILVSFAFLGVAFYMASGGANYTPAPNSFQVALRDKPFFAPPRPATTPVEIADEEETLPQIITPRTNAVKKIARTKFPAPAKHEDTSYAGLSALWHDESGEDEMGDDKTGQSDITLAAPAHSLNGGNAMDRRPIERIGTFDAETLAHDVRSVPIDQAVISTQMPADIRQIVGDAANMRSGPSTDFDKVQQLSRGTSVEVLDRLGAWVNLRDVETGQTGWMADWLISAAQ